MSFRTFQLDLITQDRNDHVIVRNTVGDHPHMTGIDLTNHIMYHHSYLCALYLYYRVLVSTGKF